MAESVEACSAELVLRSRVRESGRVVLVRGANGVSLTIDNLLRSYSCECSWSEQIVRDNLVSFRLPFEMMLEVLLEARHASRTEGRVHFVEEGLRDCWASISVTPTAPDQGHTVFFGTVCPEAPALRHIVQGSVARDRLESFCNVALRSIFPRVKPDRQIGQRLRLGKTS